MKERPSYKELRKDTAFIEVNPKSNKSVTVLLSRALQTWKEDDVEEIVKAISRHAPRQAFWQDEVDKDWTAGEVECLDLPEGAGSFRSPSVAPRHLR